jgi:hypothetical protein
MELKILREKKVNGIITRAKAKWQVEGEKSIRYFCNLEKRHYLEKTIPNLILDNDIEASDQNVQLSKSTDGSHSYSSITCLISSFTFLTNFSSLNRLLLNFHVPLHINQEIIDECGNFIILDINIQDYRMTLVAIYGPNEDNPDFFKKLVSLHLLKISQRFTLFDSPLQLIDPMTTADIY